MPTRTIIKIDEDKCDGCGQCIVDCEEGALALVDGKAKLVKESFCDGLGACIGNCPTGALTLEEREAPAFELLGEPVDAAAPGASAHQEFEAAMFPHSAACPSGPGAGGQAGFGGCPGSRSRQFRSQAATVPADTAETPSALGHWPVQLHLVNFSAPHFQQADVLIAADCSAFACGAFHPRFLKGKAVAITCPKLDDPSGYLDKLTVLFQQAQPRSVTVVRMEVPCCHGIMKWMLAARARAGSTIPIEEIVLGVEGAVIARNQF